MDAFLIKLEKQDYRCAICGTSDWGKGKNTNRPHVDHNHENGKVRGLLCNTCNRALGMFEDDKNLLRKAANYLETYE